VKNNFSLLWPGHWVSGSNVPVDPLIQLRNTPHLVNWSTTGSRTRNVNASHSFQITALNFRQIFFVQRLSRVRWANVPPRTGGPVLGVKRDKWQGTAGSLPRSIFACWEALFLRSGWQDNVPSGTSLQKIAVYCRLVRIASVQKNLDKRSRRIDRWRLSWVIVPPGASLQKMCDLYNE